MILDLALPGDPLFTVYTAQSLLPRYITVDPSAAGTVTSERGTLWSNGTLRFRLDSQFGTHLYLGVAGSGCDGRLAHLVVTVDGAVIVDEDATQGPRWVVIDRPFPDGVHDFVVTVSGDPNTATCDGWVSLIAADIFGEQRP